jgi:hypothetical protein
VFPVRYELNSYIPILLEEIQSLKGLAQGQLSFNRIGSEVLHSIAYEEYCILGCEAVQFSRCS